MGTQYHSLGGAEQELGGWEQALGGAEQEVGGHWPCVHMFDSIRVAMRFGEGGSQVCIVFPHSWAPRSFVKYTTCHPDPSRDLLH